MACNWVSRTPQAEDRGPAAPLLKLFLIYLVLGLPAPAGADALDEVRRTGVLTWGADPEGGAPYVFPDPAAPERYIGFEADLAEVLARDLGARARLVPVDWTSLIPALQRGDFHMALNGLEWTGARAREVDFSDPYYIYTQQLVTRASQTGIQSLRDLPGREVATLAGSVAQQILERLPGVRIRFYEGQVEPYRDLALGRIDAVFMDLPIAAWYAAPDPRLRLRGEPVAEGVYAIAFRKEDQRLKNEINRSLRRRIADGTLPEIYRKWGLWNATQLNLAEARHSARAVTEARGAAGWGHYLRLLLQGAGMTVLLSVVSMALAMAAGAGLTALRLSGRRLLNGPAIAYIELMRGTPLLLQLYILYYGLPNIGIQLNAFTAAVLGLGLNYAAYEAEIYRAGLESLPPGQAEAGLSLGMTRGQVYRRILIPQALRRLLPPVTNDFIALFKDSSLVSIIAIVELTKTYNMLAVSTMKFLELGLLTAALYLMMSLPLSWLSARLERGPA